MIEYRRVHKTFPGGNVAVRDFSLTIPSGSLTVLVGSSGCGKTTLLRMVNRMVEPDSGSVLIDDEDVRQRDPVTLRRSVGYVMQSGGLLPHKSVIDNIQTVSRLVGTPKAQSRERAEELMELVGLDPSLATRYPQQLSGGQQQRVGVARALAVDPNILLMDEPFGAVDPVVRRDLQRELLDLQARLSKTVVFVTHDIDEAFLVADQMVILREGAEVAQQGTPEDILSSPADDFVASFIGHTTAARRLERSGTHPDVVVDTEGRIQGRLDR
ncbi:osmoprotectant ABC ATP-binding protein [Pontimonas salivibrio]|uniref:ABC-type quaternary amine transporter n=1 Tax=Pontimonas salivibrio TaxID=1159327 RepID=A0A2L2BQ14_9MICO|nr:ATP-binding cassette domain-containing protein [Pontimonas salivibrio]AVG23761.1 osmoprotectant ABC ATP-binding protein [Pontimonas salivibrio]